jgi:peptidoglycan L-alanyl-D-glutamate endopeptidase CwlK
MQKMEWGILVVQAMFPVRARVNVAKYFSIVERALDKYTLTEKRMRLVAYATIRAESGSFEPVLERSSIYNTLKIPAEYRRHGEAVSYNLYERRASLGNESFGDGERYMGRGFIQLTGRANYKKYGELMGVDLVANPERANEPGVAAEVLALFIKQHEAKISSALDKDDLKAVRKIVNGGTVGLDDFVTAYRKGVGLITLRDKDSARLA